MPFNTTAGHPFSEEGISTYAPPESGVYGIYNNTEWIYVGESQNIEKDLYAHLRSSSEPSYCILSRSPAQFVFDLGDEMWRKARRDGLVEELKPGCNWT